MYKFLTSETIGSTMDASSITGTISLAHLATSLGASAVDAARLTGTISLANLPAYPVVPGVTPASQISGLTTAVASLTCASVSGSVSSTQVSGLSYLATAARVPAASLTGTVSSLNLPPYPAVPTTYPAASITGLGSLALLSSVPAASVTGSFGGIAATGGISATVNGDAVCVLQCSNSTNYGILALKTNAGSNTGQVILTNAGAMSIDNQGRNVNFTGPVSVGGTALSFLSTATSVPAASVTGLGSLALLSSVPFANVSGLGYLANATSVPAASITGLGSLALLSSVPAASITGLGFLSTATSVPAASVTGLGSLALLSSVPAASVTGSFGGISTTGGITATVAGDAVALVQCSNSTNYGILALKTNAGTYTGQVVLTNAGAMSIDNQGRNIAVTGPFSVAGAATLSGTVSCGPIVTSGITNSGSLTMGGASGVKVWVGLNNAGNRQLWIQDSTVAATSTIAAFRIATGSGGSAYIDAVSTDGTTVLPMTIAASQVVIPNSLNLTYAGTFTGKTSQLTNDAGFLTSVGTLASLAVTGTVTSAGILTTAAVVSPTVLSPYTSSPAFGYYREGSRVYLRGYVSGNSGIGYYSFYQLPAGYRPAQNTVFNTNTDVTSRLQITTTGYMGMESGVNSVSMTWWLDGLSFSV